MKYDKTDSWLRYFQNIREGTTETPYQTIDARIHAFLRSVSPTDPLWFFIETLRERQERKFTPLLYDEQIDSLDRATETVRLYIRKNEARRDELEGAYIYMCTVFKDIAHFSPKILEKYSDTHHSIEMVADHFQEILTCHNTLAVRLSLLDDSASKIETRRLIGLMRKINYFIEYKRFQTHSLMEVVSKLNFDL